MSKVISTSSTVEEKPRILTVIFFALATIEAFVISWISAGQPAKLEISILLGLSVKKLFLATSLVGLGVIFFALAVLMWRGGKLANRVQSLLDDQFKRERLAKLFLWAGLLCWVVLAAPSSWFGRFEAYFLIVEPALLLFFFIAIQIVFLLKLGSSRENLVSVKTFLASHKKILTIWLGIALAMCLAWIVIAVTKTGLDLNSEDFWYEAGVPVLGLQALAGLVVGLVGQWVTSRGRDSGNHRRQDKILFFAIWILSGAVWALVPAPNGFNNPGPYPPTYETYPFADAATFDSMSQFALIGQGINDGYSYSRPFYPAFLLLNHLVTGQDYDRNMQFQAAVLGLLPALVYLIGTNLVSRGAGLAAATVILLRGINGILATDLINLANQKQMLGDYPAAVGIALVILLCLRWMKSPGYSFLPYWIGGITAVTIYLRPTAVGILPVLALIPFVLKKLSGRSRLSAVAMISVGTVLVMIPWETRGFISLPERGREGYSESVRYPSTVTKIIAVVQGRYNLSPKDTGAANGSGERPPDNHQADGAHRPEQNQEPFLIVITHHLARNLIMSILALPTSAGYEDLTTIIKTDDSVWDSSWSGELGFTPSLSLLLNILLVALGLALCIRQDTWTGLLPLAIFGSYQLANSLGRTSGGRYLVPVDWILVMFFSIGIFQVGRWSLNVLFAPGLSLATRPLLEDIRPETKKLTKTTHGIVLFSLLATGFLVVLPDFTFQKEFSSRTKTELSNQLFAYDLEGNADFARVLLNDRTSIILEGKILYPRYYNIGQGEGINRDPYRILEFPRLAFEFIGPRGIHYAILPAPGPSFATNITSSSLISGVNAIILGCSRGKTIDVAILIIESTTEEQVFIRQPSASQPVCPFPVPVCENSDHCK